MKVRDLKNIINRNFTNIDKKIGVELVDTGFLKYTKLTPENYYHWWYEVENKKEVDPKNYTYDWNDLQPTYKMETIKYLITRHEDYESAYKLIDKVLQLHSSQHDGLSTILDVYDTLYNNRFDKQLF
jgi:spore coat polysaccharide biosynthesis protein SpsF (cytidylyltransferase family)